MHLFQEPLSHNQPEKRQPFWILGPAELCCLSIVGSLWSIVTHLWLVHSHSAVSQMQALWAFLSLLFAVFGIYGIRGGDYRMVRMWGIWFLFSKIMSLMADWSSVGFAFYHLKGCIPDRHGHCKNLELLRVVIHQCFCLSAVFHGSALTLVLVCVLSGFRPYSSIRLHALLFATILQLSSVRNQAFQQKPG
ncbi:hypothetical protein BC829DRAFT_382879 [Chytridium lagenaria]|nr:hypothetical protein BC829DRAFT_382879 [Chytridium lagenaria]